VLVAKTKNNMGEALRIEGKYDEALQLYTQVLELLVYEALRYYSMRP
jgi:hypothetical protein